MATRGVATHPARPLCPCRIREPQAAQLGVVRMNFVPVDAGVPQLGLTVTPAAAAGLVTGRNYKFTAVEDQEEAVS